MPCDIDYTSCLVYVFSIQKMAKRFQFSVILVLFSLVILATTEQKRQVSIYGVVL